MTPAIDTDLVCRAADSDPDAVATLLERVRPGVVRYCRARLGRDGDGYTSADDVAQDVCLALLRALPTYRDLGRPFTAFVFGIAAHKVADAQRAAARGAEVGEADDVAGDLAAEPDDAPGPAEVAENTDLARQLSRLLSGLSGRQREIVLLRVAVGLSAEEVGEVVGMSAAAVRVAQSRALARLRALAAGNTREVTA